MPGLVRCLPPLLLLLLLLLPLSYPLPCSEQVPVSVLAALAPDRERLPAGVEVVYDDAASTHAYHLTPRAATLSFPARTLLPRCTYWPEEFSVLVTLRGGGGGERSASSRDEGVVALMSPGAAQPRFGIRLHRGRVHVDYHDRRRRKATSFKHVEVTDAGWHTLIVAVTADRVSLQMDCGKRRTKRLARAFPARLDIRTDNIHVGNLNSNSRGRFTGYVKQVILLAGADISQQACPDPYPPGAHPHLPDIALPPPLNNIPGLLPPLDYDAVCSWQTSGRMWFDIYKKTLNVCYSGVWQTVLLPPEERGPRKMDYLVWHQDIVTAAPTIDLDIFRIPDEGLFMVTASFDSRELSKQQSAIFKWEGGRFKLFQSMYTLGAQAWEHFSIGKKFFLAVANEGGERDKPSKSVVYAWHRRRRRFRVYQELVTFTARDIEHFSIQGEHFLAVANHVQGHNHSVSSVIFAWDAETGLFKEHQLLPTRGAYDFTHFSVDGFHFLVVANAFSGPPERTTRLASVIYFWTDGQFLPFQSLQTIGATDWEAFTVGDDFFLVVSNAYDYGPDVDPLEDPYQTNSSIYRLNKTLKTFELYQNITTYSAVDWEFFTVGDDSFLIVSNAQKAREHPTQDDGTHGESTLARTHSVVYRWQGVEKFQPVHYLDTFPSADWEVFTMDGEVFLVYANAKNNISQMYRVKFV